MSWLLWSVLAGLCLAISTDDDRSHVLRTLALCLGVSFAIWAFR